MYYVYRFKDASNKIIYVGRTDNLDQRMSRHFTKTGHLPSDCYNRTKIVEYIEVDSYNECSILEIYFISQYSPVYNVRYAGGVNTLSLDASRYKWTKYVFKEESTLRRFNLIAARSDSGMTQLQVAEHIGVGVNQYYRLESGRVDGSVEVWRKLRSLFGKPIDELLKHGDGTI